jgi:ABC-type polysaccharide/polyol phosphate export permease
VAALTVIFKRATALVAAVLTVLSLLSGVYFPIEVLPEALQALSEAIPFTWALDVLRASLLGGEVDELQLVGLLAAAAVSLPVALFIFRASVDRARRLGSLADY